MKAAICFSSFALLAKAVVLPPFSPDLFPAVESTLLPLVIWHGLGDSFEQEGLKNVAKLAQKVNPSTYVHVIRIGETGDSDREASFLGDLNLQVDEVCSQLASNRMLSEAPAINALGFSQGGQFLRAYIQRCNKPPVHNLVTFGSQHNGISDFKMCEEAGDWLCRASNAMLEFGTWSSFVQLRLVPAQYFRDPEALEDYRKFSNFLADINNERDVKNETYKQNLIRLNKFVMYIFDSDHTVVPKESGHFIEVNTTTGEKTALQDRPIYTEDWLGLKVLDEQKKLEFLTTPGEHMQISTDLLKDTFHKYFGPAKVKSVDRAAADFEVQASR